MSKAGFNKLAKFYSGLEYIAFGNLLLRSRFALLSELKDLKQVLIIGGGNGRLLKRIIEDFPDAKIDFLEQSPAMIKIAKSRLTASQLERVGFIEADIFSFTSTNLYDCIFSPFFLDCFNEQELAKIIDNLSLNLRSQAYWYDIDFNLPEFGFARARAKLYLKVLYKFFNITTNLKVNHLVNTEAIFLNNYQILKTKTFSNQLLKTAIYKKN